MCWNAEVSLNTFLFSSFVLLLIMYNNTYTKYKIHDIDSTWKYIFFFSFISMQLVEYFIWKNINNKYYNNLFSIIATLLLIWLPITSIMMLKENDILKWILVLLYLILVGPFVIYKFMKKHVYSNISPMHHLQWKFLTNKTEFYYWVIWLFFFFFSLLYNLEFGGILFGTLLLLVMIYNYKTDGTISSMWCWVANSIMLYYAIYLLLYLL
jgi:hypothetical protein